jgi:hypothetical protein
MSSGLQWRSSKSAWQTELEPSVKSNRAVVLALVGWYLIAPPYMEEEPHVGAPDINLDAPLSAWSPRGVFDSEIECGEARIRANNDADRALGKMYERSKRKSGGLAEPFRGFELSTAEYLESMMWPKCVASDDPRLKGN